MAIDRNEFLRIFKQGQLNVEQMVRDFGEPRAEDMLQLLSLLQSRLPGDQSDQRLRCAVFARLGERMTDRELFAPFVKALRTAAAPLSTTLASLIPRVNNVAAHADLCALLKTPDGQMRRLVAQPLRELGGTTVFRALTELCGERDFPGRIEAMDIIISIGRQHAIPALASVLAVGNQSEKLQAIEHLSNSELMSKDLAGAARVIQSALKDANERVVTAAIVSFSAVASEDEYFRDIGPLLDSGNLALVGAAVAALKRYGSPRAIAAIEKKLRMGPNAIRLHALATLEHIGTDDVLGAVVAALGSKHLAVRTRAAEVITALAIGKKIDVARAIMWLLRSPQAETRRMAADIAKKVGDPSGELAPRLLRYLRDEDWWVRERVMDALAHMAGKQLTRHLVLYLQDESDVIRRYAVDALERVADPGAAGALVRAAQGDSDWWVRERAIEALAALKDPRTVPYIVDIMMKQPDLARCCVLSLMTMKAREAAPHVAALLAPEADDDLKIDALDCLKDLDDAAQAPAVAVLESDPNPRVRVRAQDMLKRWDAIGSRVSVTGDAHNLTALERLLVATGKADADDLILEGGKRPYLKKSGKIAPLADKPLSPDEVRAILLPALGPKQMDDLRDLRDADFSVEIKSAGLRFRANVFHEFSGLSGVFRIIKDQIPVVENLGLPKVALGFGDLKNGLVLVGGPTGSGKSTTLAGIIDYINRTSSRHVITLEDPIEVIHKHKKSLLTQREIGAHTLSFERALRSTLREDPDVILVGEMRDHATLAFALTAAETGHLVFGTLHTVSADTSVDRVVNAFPPGQQPQVRALLADTLRAVMCQYLLNRKDGQGRVLAVEILLNNDAVANLIRKGKTFQIPQVVATSRELGMQAMDSDLERLYKEGMISAEDAYMKSYNKKLFETLIAEDQGKPDRRDATVPASGAPAAASAAARAPGRPTTATGGA